MRLCFLAAGDSLHSFRWVRYFAGRGHEVHWLSLKPFIFARLPSTRYYDLSSDAGRWPDRVRAIWRIRRLVRSIRPDILHAHYVGMYGLLGVASGWHPLVATAWGSDILLLDRFPMQRSVVRWILREAKLITCDAQHMKTAMVKLGTNPNKIVIVRFGIEVEEFSPGPPNGSVMRGWGAEGRPVILSLRTLEPIYDIRTLIEAVPLVVKSHPETLFVVYGEGSLEVALRRQVSELGVDAHVRFAGRYLNANLPDMLRSATIYVSTSLSDAGIAASTAEAMSCSLPVVVTLTGENHEWIRDGCSGYLVAPRASADLAERIVYLLEHADVRASFGRAARAVIVERNDWGVEMKRMENLYTEVGKSEMTN